MLRRSSIFARTVLSLAVCAACAISGAYAQTPAPPVGPPEASPDAADFSLYAIRRLLQDEIEQLLPDINENIPATVSLIGEGPRDCGYDCFSKPRVRPTSRLDWPNENIVVITGDLAFDVTGSLPVNRTIYIGYELQASCIGWMGNAGKLQISATFRPPVVEGDRHFIEVFFNAFLLPLNISGRISQGIKERIEDELDGIRQRLQAISGIVLDYVPCTSLGSAGTSPETDRLLWDLPRVSLGEPAAPVRSVTVTFDGIERLSDAGTISLNDDVAFDVFLNVNPTRVPAAGTVNLDLGETQPYEDSITLDADRLFALQILFLDSNGGSGWVHFEKDELPSSTSGTVTTVRTVMRPRPGGGRPIRFELKEYGLHYTITSQGPEVLVAPVSP